MATGDAGDAGDLMGMPDDTFAMVLAAIHQPQAAACMLATCQRVCAALRAPDSVPEAVAPRGCAARLLHGGRSAAQEQAERLHELVARGERRALGELGPRERPPTEGHSALRGVGAHGGRAVHRSHGGAGYASRGCSPGSSTRVFGPAGSDPPPRHRAGRESAT